MSTETGVGKIHPQAAKSHGNIDWDMKKVRYRGKLENREGNTWGVEVYEPTDTEFKEPIGREVQIVDLIPDPPPPDRSQL